MKKLKSKIIQKLERELLQAKQTYKKMSNNYWISYEDLEPERKNISNIKEKIKLAKRVVKESKAAASGGK